MKPRLKLTTEGRLTVLRAGELPWTEHEAIKCIRRRYGSVVQFARQWRLSYGACVNAFRSPSAERRAGRIAEVRTMLGLSSQPGEAALRAAKAYAAWREAKHREAGVGDAR